MSDIPGLLVALVLPPLVGYAWLQRFWPEAHPATRMGYGYLVGMLLMVLIFLAGHALGWAFHFVPMVVFLAVIGLLPFLFERRPVPGRPLAVPQRQPGWQVGLWWFFLLLLSLRAGGLLLEDVLRPLYPWDAWMNWAPRAKVWFETAGLAPFVSPEDWGKAGEYTLGNPKAVSYPPLVPLVQAWIAAGIGTWRDNWINLPWFFCGLALLSAFYGQLRMAGMAALPSMLFSYLLFSMPYLDTHIALAGYADLWMSTAVALGLMALANWCLHRSRQQLFMVLFMVLFCLLTKAPGMVWATVLASGLLLALAPVWLRWGLLILFVAAMAALWVRGGIVLNIGDSSVIEISADLIRLPGLGAFPVEYHPVGEYFVKNLLLWDNWHLMGWLLAAFMPFALWQGFRSRHKMPVAWVIFLGMLFLFVVFFFTPHYQSAIDSTTLNRAVFHLVPAAVFYMALVIKDMVGSEKGAQPE